MGVWADRMVTRLQAQASWPAADDRRVWEQVRTWIAFAENDRNVLRMNARWRNQVREYLIDPLGPKISEAFASTIFGRPPVVTPANPADVERMKLIVQQNNLGRRCQREHKRVSSEAESWWRITSNPELDQTPMLTFSSRLDVIPTFANDKLRSAAFLSDLYLLEGDTEETRWRHFEIIDGQSIVNVLFYGTHQTVGERQALTAHPETADLADSVEHELPHMPCGRVINKEATDIFYGISDFAGIEDFLYELNEILTIFRENVRLTLKKRAVVPASAVDESGTIDASQEILVNESLHDSLDKSGAGAGASQFQVLQYKSDIEECITAQNAIAEGALTRTGITPAYVGMTTDKSEGMARSGTALRLRLIPTVNAAEDRAAFWDDELPVMLTLLQMLDSREVAGPGDVVLGGFGRPWVDPVSPPSVARGPSLPQDPVEDTEMHATRVSATIESRYTAIAALHTGWSDEQILEEIGRIETDLQQNSGGALGKLFGTGTAATEPRGDS